jgi:ketol-acid reductoisomerase
MFCPRVFPVHTKDLVDLLQAQSMENMMKSISNQIMTCNYPSRKHKNNLHKESIKKDNDENQVI